MEASTSSIIGALGGGSGVDMVRLASDLAATRFAARIQQLESKSELLETRISSASTLRSSLSQLASALGDRIRTGDLAPKPTIGNSGVASVKAQSGANTTNSYSLEVQQLAGSQTLASKSYASSADLVGEGTLTISFGEVAGSGFTPDAARDPVAITIDVNATLSDVAAAINESGSGVSAYVANGPTGAQLVFKGADGSANGFTVEGSGASASGTDILGNPQPSAAGNINHLSWNPATDAGELRATAQNAEFLFDTIAMTSVSNSVTDLPGGLSLNLTGTNIGAPTRIGFARGDAAVQSVMGDFVAALNDIAAQLSASADPIGGELGSDAGARRLKRELAGLAGLEVMPNAASGEPRTLGDLGLAINRDGTFRLDSKRLGDTLASNSEAASAMFTTGLYGVFATFDKLARKMAAADDPGSLGGSVTRYTASANTIAEQLEKIAQQQATLTTRLTAQFAASDRNVAASQSTLSFLQSQIAIWNADR